VGADSVEEPEEAEEAEEAVAEDLVGAEAVVAEAGKAAPTLIAAGPTTAAMPALATGDDNNSASLALSS
jgi:hypothetical protein